MGRERDNGIERGGRRRKSETSTLPLISSHLFARSPPPSRHFSIPRTVVGQTRRWACRRAAFGAGGGGVRGATKGGALYLPGDRGRGAAFVQWFTPLSQQQRNENEYFRSDMSSLRRSSLRFGEHICGARDEARGGKEQFSDEHHSTWQKSFEAWT